jgi:hypothetical protein
VGLLVVGELGEDGDGEALVCGGFGVGEVAFFVSEVAEAFLQVKRERVIYFGADAVFCEEGADFVPMRDPNNELVVDVVVRQAGVEPRLGGEGECGEFWRVCECFAVPTGFGSAFGAPEVEVWEFDVEDGGLDGVDAEVAPDVGVEVARFHAVVAKATHFCRECVVLTGDHSGIAEGAEIFCGIEGVPTGFTDGACGSEGVRCAERLGGIFENGNAVGCADAGDGFHVRAAAEEMDWADGFGVGVLFEGVFQLGWVDVEGVGLDVDEYGARTDASDTACGCEEGVGGGDDGVAGLDAERHEENELGVGAGGDADAVAGACRGADGFFEIFRFFAEHELLGVTDFGDFGEDLFAERFVLERQIEKRHVHPITVPDSLHGLKGNVLSVGLGGGILGGQRCAYECGF